MPLTAAHEEALGKIVDRAENALFAAKLPGVLGPTHVEGLTGTLREIRDAARKLYVEIEGNDPWADNPLVG
jgi:hypothetical protein